MFSGGASSAMQDLSPAAAASHQVKAGWRQSGHVLAGRRCLLSLQLPTEGLF